ncbi:MAG TPA: ABC transporter permease [Acidimicrobiia bacterium]|nr:ABC transporter permease [Acidimicrobiia bacterium]
MTLVTTLVIGLSLGAVYALLAAGVTVVYQAVRIPNVAVVAIGTVAAVLHGELMAPDGRVGSGLGWWQALAVAVGVATLLGLACDLLTRGLREQVVPALVALLGLSAVLLAGVNAVWGSEAKLLPPPSATLYEHGDLQIARSDVVTLLLAAAVAAALTLFLGRTRLGLALRAQASDTEGARLAGVNPATVSRVAWVVSSALGAVAMTLALHPVLVNTYEATVYVAFAVAAAAVGGFRSLRRAALAGMFLGVVPTLFQPRDLAVGGIGNLVAFLVLAVILFRRPGLIGRPALDEVFSSASADNAPPTARRRAALTAVGASLPTWARRGALAALAVGLAVVVPWLSTDVAIDAWARGIAIFLICASIVIMSGWTGDLPLGHVAFAGIGAYLVGDLSGRAGLPHFAAIPLAALAALPYALALGIPAFRSRGRLAFAALSLLGMVVAATLLWGPGARWFTGRVSITRRPDWMEALSGRPAVSYYLVALLVAAAVVWFATNIRRSRVGRALAASRDSDAATRGLGIDPAHYRLVALSFSAVVAALGGILLAYGEHPLDPTRFAVFLSVQYFLYTVVGGARSLAGTAVVVFAFEIAPALGQGTPPTGPASVLVLGALAAVTVAFVPGGLAGLAQRVAGRLAPAPTPVPALTGAGASTGFIDIGGDADPNAFDPYAPDDADDA